MSQSSGTLSGWHRDSPTTLRVSITVNDDGTGTLSYTGLSDADIKKGSYYNYRLRFLVSNTSDLPSGCELSGDEKGRYNGTPIIASFYGNTGDVDFDLGDLGIDTSQTIYFYYFCSLYDWPSSGNYSDVAGDNDCGSVWQASALIVAPSISELSLKNPKSDSTTVANSSSEISITASKNGGDDYTKWETWIKGPGRMGSDNDGEYYSYTEGDYFNNHYDTFHSLQPRTEYSFAARMSNSAGNSGWTGTKTYRTLSDPPAMSAKAKSKTLNSVTFTWTSNYDLNKVYYQYKTTGNWSSEYSQGIDGKKTGDITISGIAPNTTVYIRVKGTENWDSQTSSYPENAHASQTTYDIASTEISTSIIHSGTVNLINTKNPSGNTMTLVMYDGNDTIASWNIATNTSSVSLSEAQWDNVYKRYGNSNTKNYSFYLYTANDSGTWNSYNRNVARTVTLTGIQKTAHVGNNGAKRAMVWYSVNGVMKHAVVWVGAGGGTKRTI